MQILVTVSERRLLVCILSALAIVLLWNVATASLG
jgi:hypothetical protein